MNEDELTDALRRILPEQPSADGWAGAARRRRQQHRAAVGAAVMAVVAAVAIPVGLGLGNSSPQVLTTPAPEPSAAGQLIPDACGWPAVDAAPLSAGELRGDPERVWLCGQGDDRGTNRRTVGAADPLEMGAAEAVRALGELPLERGLADCAPNPLSYLYTLVLEYPDGTHSSVSADHCGFLRDEADDQDYFREADEEFVETLRELWQREREATGFQFPGTGELCSNMSSSVWRPLDQSTLTRAVACHGEDARPTELPADLAADLVTSLDATETKRPEEILFGGQPELVFLTPAGDPLSLMRWGEEGTGQGLLAWDEGAENHAWAIPSELQQRIDDYLAQTPITEQTPPPVSPTLGAEDVGGLTSKVCADVQSGAVAPGFLGRTEDLPTGAEKIWLCGDLNDPFDGVLGPREPLVTDPDRVVGAINALESAPDGEVACTLMGGLTFHLAIDYPDGSRRILAAETVNCAFVGGGRVGGGKLLEQITPLWEQQRATLGPAEVGNPVLCDTFQGPADRYGGHSSFLPVDISDVVQGAACGLSTDATGFDGEVLQRELPVPLVRAIANAETFREPLSHVQPRGLPYLVLLNQFGDSMTVEMTVDGDLLTAAGVWMPDPDTATLLADTLPGIRTQPFYEEPSTCSNYVEGEDEAALGEVVAGAACVQAFAVPQKGPELEPDFAKLLATRFEAESVPLSWGARSSHVALVDGEGRGVNLYYDNRNHFDASLVPGLVNEAGTRVWVLPDDVKAELELYGFDFTQQ